MARPNIAVVGAGVGGLSAAARLSAQGYSVDVFEKLPHCGGRNNIIRDKGFLFDTGPSFVLMPEYFEEAFGSCGVDLGDTLPLKVLDENYRIFYPDGDVFTVHRDCERTKREMERIEPGSARGFDEFLRVTGTMYRALKPYLFESFSPSAPLNPRYWPLLSKLNLPASYWTLASRFFKSEKLRFAFTFEAMFMGVSPFRAPGFYSIIAYTDHVDKIRHPMGGMYRIPQTLEEMCRRKGVRFHYGSEVSGIHKNGSFTLRTPRGEARADRVVVNADYSYAQETLLGRRLPKFMYSCSVYLLYLGLSRKVPGLAHHNLFFSSDVRQNLREIFTERKVPTDPSFYIHVPTVTDPSLAPPDKDLVYVLIPVNNREPGSEPFEGKEAQLKRKVFEVVKQRTGIDLGPLVEVEHAFYPKDFTERYNIKYGATFGLAHNLLQSAFFRPYNADRRMPGLYYVGASTQPGGGLPVVLASARIVSDMISKR
jgi:phytoene desaturase